MNGAVLCRLVVGDRHVLRFLHLRELVPARHVRRKNTKNDSIGHQYIEEIRYRPALCLRNRHLHVTRCVREQNCDTGSTAAIPPLRWILRRIPVGATHYRHLVQCIQRGLRLIASPFSFQCFQLNSQRGSVTHECVVHKRNCVFQYITIPEHLSSPVLYGCSTIWIRMNERIDKTRNVFCKISDRILHASGDIHHKYDVDNSLSFSLLIF